MRCSFYLSERVNLIKQYFPVMIEPWRNRNSSKVLSHSRRYVFMQEHWKVTASITAKTSNFEIQFKHSVSPTEV